MGLIDRIEDTWRECAKCVLACDRNLVVVGTGPVPCSLMVIGEAPGEDEDAHGLPFVGMSGQFLRDRAKELGLDLSIDAYVTNIVGCRPPDNRMPMFNEIQMCRPRVDGLVAAVQPKVILTLGGTAMTALTGKQGIHRHRGKWGVTEWDWKGHKFNIDTIHTFHPAGLLGSRLKEPKDITYFQADIKQAYDRASNYGQEAQAEGV